MRYFKRSRCRQKGMVLISTLIFLSLITGLVLISLERSGLELRMSQNWFIKARNLQVAEAGLKTAYSELKMHKNGCYRAFVASADLLNKPITWWYSSKVCRGRMGKSDFQYFIEPLSETRLLTLDGKSSVKYFKLVARADTAGMSILQATVVQSTKNYCTKPCRKISSVWQSWSELTL